MARRRMRKATTEFGRTLIAIIETCGRTNQSDYDLTREAIALVKAQTGRVVSLSDSTTGSWRKGHTSGPKNELLLLALCCVFLGDPGVTPEMIDRLLKSAHTLKGIDFYRCQRVEGQFSEPDDVTGQMIDYLCRRTGLSIERVVDPDSDPLGLLALGRTNCARSCAVVVSTFAIPDELADQHDRAERCGVNRLGDMTGTANAGPDMSVFGLLNKANVGYGGSAPRLIFDSDVDDRLHDLAAPSHERPAVQSFVLIGIFSNSATQRLAGRLPFTLHDAPPVPSVTTIDGFEMSEPEHALVSRNVFSDVTITVIGGITAVGTALLGRYLAERPSVWWSDEPSLRELAQEGPSQTSFNAVFGSRPAPTGGVEFGLLDLAITGRGGASSFAGRRAS